MKTLGRTIFLLTNLGLGILYGYEILKYFHGVYNYDGMRYLVPIAITDILLLISLVFLYFAYGFNKELLTLFCLATLHNVAHGCGVERIPFIGCIISIISILYLVKRVTQSSPSAGVTHDDN